ncbi:RDD family protein [Nocardioides jiangxiensis]|uniref:RDD family protein n=1 Tax=Nocardioides jiangxiensis TaxID=3064524 RepID=A0ABT9B2T9_9ACTN|nr:RDD family protein [Nocardioides sp. WY-20]MDO7869139.1 RDD family protein [Nocardioides sp. WY-20]
MPTTGVPTLRYWDGTAWTEHVAPAQQYVSPAYAARPAGPTTPDGVPLASYGARVLAQIIDIVVLVVPSLVLTLPSQVDSQERLQNLSDRYLTSTSPDVGAYWHGYVGVLRDQFAGDAWVTVIGFLYIVLMLRWKGATLGKLALGLRVRLREQPGRLPWGAIGIRVLVASGLAYLCTLTVLTGSLALTVVGFLVMMVFGFLDVLWPLWDGKRQALHDKAARTNVVSVR